MTGEDVRRMRAAGLPWKAIAARMGVSLSAAHKVGYELGLVRPQRRTLAAIGGRACGRKRREEADARVLAALASSPLTAAGVASACGVTAAVAARRMRGLRLAGLVAESGGEWRLVAAGDCPRRREREGV